MDSANAQKILGYFIEEAKEHLETLERGILDLANMANDPEQINEMFRAAHSVKGGAAMLGYGSIQKTAHRLEDAFKILKENSIKVDRKLESLLLKGYDMLQELVDKLQGPFGLQNDEANAIVANGEPTFQELQSYLAILLGKGTSGTGTHAPASLTARDILKQMLQLFKKEESTASRQQLQQLCADLIKIAPGESQWQNLTKMAAEAIANPKHSYRTLAPIVIKELKQGSDLIEIGRGSEISASKELQQLSRSKLPQILITLEPRSVASTLLEMFDRQQVSQLVQLLQTAR